MQFNKLIRILLRHSVLAMGLAASMSALAWKAEWDFEEGVVGSKVSGWNAAGATVHSDDRGYNSARSARLTAAKGSTGWGNWGGYIDHPSRLTAGDEVWFRVRTFFPLEWIPSSEARQKFMRIRTLDSAGKKGEGYIDLYLCATDTSCAFKFIFEGENRWATIGNRKDYTPQYGTWETYEFYVRLDSVPASQGGKALIRFWKNGELVKEITDRKTLKTATSIADRTLLFTWWGNNGAPVTQSMWVDDVHLTSTRPNDKDRNGNYFIGMGGAPMANPPLAPVLNVSP